MKTRLLALLCRFCPVCAVARMRPESNFAKKLREMEKDCPACKAYRQVYKCKSVVGE